MDDSTLVRSSLGTFVTRIGTSVAIFLGVFYLAAVAGPAVLGTYSLFVAVVRVLDFLTNVGINEATQKRISEGADRGAFFIAGLFVRGALFVPFACVVLVFEKAVTTYVGHGAVVPFLLVGSLAYLVRRALEAGLIGEKKVARAGVLPFVYATGQLVVWVVLVSLDYGLVGVFAGYVVGQLLAIGAGLMLHALALERPSRRHFRSLYDFAKYSWVGTVTTEAWVWTDTLVLGVFVAQSLIGVYELSWRITGVLFLLSSAISRTLFATISDLATRDDPDRIAELLERSLVYTGILAIPGLVGGIILAEPLLAMFGDEYRVGAVVVAVLILARLLHSYEVVFGKVIDALDRPDLTLRTNTMFVVVNVVLNVVAVTTVGWIGAAIATTVAMVLKTVLSYHYIRSLVDLSVPLREIILEGIAALVMGTCLLVLLPTATGSLPMFETVLYVTVGAVVYAVALLMLVDRVRIATTRVLF
jgi:O-antigen/teichoic acid export membrane protein